MKRGTPRSKKTKRLAKALGVPIFAVVGLLEMLWHFTAEQSPAGDIGSWTDEEICEELGWTGVLGGVAMPELVPALVGVGFLDMNATHRLLVHDWAEHADDAVHATLARSGRLFADGSLPRLTRLSKDERDKCAEKLTAAQAARGTAPSGDVAAHDVRTECAGQALDGALPLPCPAPPSPALAPAPSGAAAASGGGTAKPAAAAVPRSPYGLEPELLQRAKRDFPHYGDLWAVICVVWCEANTGPPPRIDLTALDPLERKVSLGQIVAHLRMYLETVAPQYQSLPKFVSKFAHYAPKPKVVKAEHRVLDPKDFAVMERG